mmetsp:Transcript_102316/g.318720  ORF Transcript_102316/g.318720 Transcript_102316/m.318720 type:complete len:179 (+) Transcript_102316:94-630(+)
MSSARLALLVLPLLASVPGAATGGLRGSLKSRAGRDTAAVRASSKAYEEFKAFDSASVDLQGWNAFLAAATSSARSSRDTDRQRHLDAEVKSARSLDVSISDDFADLVGAQAAVPSLRELAKEHWNGIKPAQVQQKAKVQTPKPDAPKTPPAQVSEVQRPEGHASLRSLLRSAVTEAL